MRQRPAPVIIISSAIFLIYVSCFSKTPNEAVGKLLEGSEGMKFGDHLTPPRSKIVQYSAL